MLAGLLAARGHCGGRGAAGTGTGRGLGNGTEPPQHHAVLQNVLSKPVAGCSPPRAISIYCDSLAFITSGVQISPARRAAGEVRARGCERGGTAALGRPAGWFV